MTFYAGDILYASDLNALAIAPVTRVTRAATQSTTSGAAPLVTWDTEVTDTLNLYTSSTDTLTIVTSGIYTVAATVEFATNATGYRIAQIELNGSQGARSAGPATATVTTNMSCAATASLTAGDTVTVRVSQNSGGNLNITAALSILYEGSVS